ncbi:MAG TPA: DUF6655 family protein [Pirellulaceae bacterium]|nr:DUF6655 family protein [Pirellulaceae bacterium]
MLALSMAGGVGCGINKSRLATEQLVISDAVDRAVAAVDFSPLSGQKVYFDTKYVDNVNLGAGANVGYVVSSLRQQMLAYDCRLQEKPETADYVVEARVGVLNYDGHEVTYGVPGNTALGTASVLLSNPVPLPAMPELSLGRRNHQAGTAKIGLFAYDRETREPVWQAGVIKASSQARDMWVLGMGPYQQRPTTHRKRGLFSSRKSADELSAADADPIGAFSSPLVFRRAVEKTAADEDDVATASHETPAEPNPIQPAVDAKPVPAAPSATTP